MNGEWLFDDVAKETFRKQLWRVADYCGVQVGTYTILSNHFHILVNVPQQTPVTDDELLRRYAVLYPKPTKYETEKLEVVKAELATNGPEAIASLGRERERIGSFRHLEGHRPGAYLKVDRAVDGAADGAVPHRKTVAAEKAANGDHVAIANLE